MDTFAIKVACCFAYVFVGIAAVAYPNKLPNGFIKCKLSDPALNECIKHGFELATPLLAKGIPSLGILANDPMRITSLQVTQGEGAVQLKIKFKELDIINLKTANITNLTYDPKQYVFKVDLTARKPIILEGQYEANGQILFLPIVGNGTCKMVLDDYKSHTVLHLKPRIKNGDTYLDVEKLSWKFITSKLHITLNNLFNGDRFLEENMNVFLNENWKELITEMQPAFEEALNVAFIAMVQQFLNKFPLNHFTLE